MSERQLGTAPSSPLDIATKEYVDAGVEKFYDLGLVSGSVSLSLSNGTLQECKLSLSYSLTASDPDVCTFTLPTMPAGTTLTLIVKQPTVGTGNGRWAVGDVTFPNVRWAGGVAPTLTRALRVADIFTFTSDGTSIFGSVTQGHIYHPPYEYSAPLAQPRRQKGTANPTLVEDGPNFLTPLDVARAYQLPNLDGTGVTVGCINFEGPPNIPTLQAYANYMGIDKTLNVQLIYMPGAESQALNPSDSEAMLDTEVLTSLVPGATHKVYMSLNDLDSFLDTMRRALSECDVVSSSWYFNETDPFDHLVSFGVWQGSPPIESIVEAEDILREARKRNVSFFQASGDWGSDVWTPYNTSLMPWHASPRRTGVPKSCPSAVSVGQTSLHLSNDGIRTSEQAANRTPTSSSGGYSVVFPDTMVPVVSAFGDFQQGYAILRSDGSWSFYSSTSGAAPTMAAVHARLIQSRGSRFDFMDFALANPGAFYDVTSGTNRAPGTSAGEGGNGAFLCKPGRDLVTGIGTPDGPAMVAALTNWSNA
jgi:kumamolisin